MKIEACDITDSYRTHGISPSVTVEQINTILGVKPVVGDMDKSTVEWRFTVDGHPCAIWDYKGVRWSAYDPHNVLRFVFGSWVYRD